MSEDFLTDVPSDSPVVDPLTYDPEADANQDVQGEETPADSSSEKPQEDVAPSQEGAEEDGGEEENPASSTPDETNEKDVPLNKDKRFRQVLDERDALRQKIEGFETSQTALLGRLDDLEKLKEAVVQNKPESVPKFIRDLYGDEYHEALAEYRGDIDNRVSSIKKEIRAEFEAERKAEADNAARWEQWAKDSIKKVEERFDVDLPEGSSERNEFADYVMKYKPTDANGVIDFTLGYEQFRDHKELQRLKSGKKTEAKKKIAAQTSSTPSGVDNDKAKVSAERLRKGTFLDLALESFKRESN